MKISPQVYVRGSVEAVEMYCKAFGAEISFQIKDEKNVYAHCELTVNGELFMAVSEAKKECGRPWHSMCTIWAVKKLYVMLMTYYVMVGL
jgi:uncharacterized glyoxalase superfamily protein PhnB